MVSNFLFCHLHLYSKTRFISARGILVKDLAIRSWECSKCGSLHDRDVNASVNIMFEGLKMYVNRL